MFEHDRLMSIIERVALVASIMLNIALAAQLIGQDCAENYYQYNGSQLVQESP
jgi:hypothetical protein